MEPGSESTKLELLPWYSSDLRRGEELDLLRLIMEVKNT